MQSFHNIYHPENNQYGIQLKTVFSLSILVDPWRPETRSQHVQGIHAETRNQRRKNIKFRLI